MPGVQAHWQGPGLEAWEAWSPRQVSRILGSATPVWCVVGGWAIDLWLGRVTRPHSDIEIAAPRSDFVELRRFFEPGYRLYAVGDGESFGLDGNQPMPSEKHQCWIADSTAGRWRLDLMLEPGDSQTWVCRRDERIKEPRGRMIDRSDGIPFLKPEGVLLYKAKAHRAKDQADFESCLPHLSPAARSWLATYLSLVQPGHQWLDAL
ncbi:MAG: amino acid transporter [Pseudomonadales bacterium]